MRDGLEQILAATAGGIAYVVAYRVARGGRSRSRGEAQNAVCVFDARHSKGVAGEVRMRAIGDQTTRFECALTGLTSGPHGFHVHTYGDLREGCKSACDHYNPTNERHGGARGRHRHAGDLGNIIADEHGRCTQSVVADVRLDDIIGRMLIVHADEDDLGASDHPDSSKTGNSGVRVACGVIGRCAAAAAAPPPHISKDA